ncbi:uncharacterized protein LOC135496679 isoform X1 [Lineus longissimus]|uniref:uncharacterized protein LOC135496679 isoform X1 n=1 Tax=Lineus longissimus TaxID=88925 RepID=UPI00315CD4F3
MYEILPNKPTPIPMEIGDSKTPGRQKLESWLNKNMKIKMTDERILVGVFVCTDKDRNVILGNCQEYLKVTKAMAWTWTKQFQPVTQNTQSYFLPINQMQLKWLWNQSMIVLSGHTHGGQMFPGSILVYLVNTYYAGLY